MSTIRLLIVDDAVVVRRLMADRLAEDPAFEVVGAAPSIRIALAKIGQVNPDLVLLNADMPDADNVSASAAIRKLRPLQPVLQYAKPQPDTETGLEELGSLGSAVHQLCDELIPRIKRCHARLSGGVKGSISGSTFQGIGRPSDPRLASLGGAGTLAAPRRSDPALRTRPRVEFVAIGASTGGPNALTALLLEFPADCPVPIVIVQHMPPVFTTFLADRLAARAAIPIHEGQSHELLVAGHAWIAPGDYHLELERDAAAVRLRLHQGPPENSCRPAVDVLFRSVADTYGPGALAVVLSGMGQDGLRGCERIREAGGQILVQDEATSVVWGMPGYVARAGLADQVLPLEQLGPEIVRRLRKGRSLSFHG